MERKTSASDTKEILLILWMTREKDQFFKILFHVFMTDRSATEQEVNNISSHDISHDLKSLKWFKFIQLSDVCWRNISYWTKAQYSFRWTQQLYKWAIYNIHFKVCIPNLLGWHWRSKHFTFVFKKPGHWKNSMNIRNRFNVCSFNFSRMFLFYHYKSWCIIISILRARGILFKLLTEPYWF